mmetsp:Transcript_398/g.476  ORF Transcript_398/g.476 Transcript_398/m.476 type:complete len:352 (+) Transcript_398:265-1320(+)
MEEENVYANRPRILLTGARRCGKTSIQKVVFEKMSPHETLFLESTSQLEIKHIANNPYIQYEVWDISGDIALQEGILYNGEILTPSMIFSGNVAMVYVIDAQEEVISDSCLKLKELIQIATSVNKNIHIEVFIHKVDGEMFGMDYQKWDCQREIKSQVLLELEDSEIDMIFNFALTSIYDHSIWEGLSKVIQGRIPQLAYMENLLNSLMAECNFEKVFFFDVVSKIYIATDHNPVDIRVYELCSDMIDVVVDVSCIYGMSEDGGDEIAYDEGSSSVIRLSEGAGIYLKQVASYLGVVCYGRNANLEKKGLIDFNVDQFKSYFLEIFENKADTIKDETLESKVTEAKEASEE